MEVITNGHWILQSLDVKDALYNVITYCSCSNHSSGISAALSHTNMPTGP